MLDRLVAVMQQLDSTLHPSYKRGRVNLVKGGITWSGVGFRPRQEFLRVEVRLPQSPEMDVKLQSAGLNLMPYKWGKYRVRLFKADLAKHEKLITELLREGFEHAPS